ncbi:DUF3352 domain-containing protein [Anaerolineae bacterium CFX9]|nr:DUF3352 domain-containing protein [Anaerolineae bacterium CFX9]
MRRLHATLIDSTYDLDQITLLESASTMNRTRRLLCAVSLALMMCLSALPMSAQSSDGLERWIPADFTGFIRLDTGNPQDALRGINVSLLVGSLIQPTRINTTSAVGYNDLLPLAGILDLESAPFDQLIVPWLGDTLILAYQNLSAIYRAQASDVLMIASTRDAFEAASVLSRVLQAQDLLETTSYRGVTVYNLDRTSIAFAPDAVLIGDQRLIHAALDAEAEESDRLVDHPAYAPIRAQLPQRDPIFAFIVDEAAANALGYVLSGSDRAAPILRALGGALSQLVPTNSGSVEQALLSGAVDAVGVSLRPDTFLISQVNVRAAYHVAQPVQAETGSILDPAVLEFIPRSAFFVHVGTDARQAAFGALSALPLANYGGRVLAAFPVGQPAISPQDLAAPPSAEDIASAVAAFSSALNAVRGVDLMEDVLAHFDGSYTVALMPRPNNPVPLLNTPFEALVAAQVDDAEAAMRSLVTLAESLFAGITFTQQETEGGSMMSLMTGDGEPIMRVGAVGENMLLVGTGDAVTTALRAHQGDNRLTAQARWQRFVDQDRPAPSLYLDLVGFYNTFQPSAGGAQAVPTGYVGLQTAFAGDDIFRTDINIYLPD